MATLQVIKIKPNPTGKDKYRNNPTPEQLAGEWVDIRNHGAYPVDMSGIVLFHRAYKSDGSSYWERICDLPREPLQPGWVLRIHSGQHRPLSVVSSADQQGASLHFFTGADRYVWNNRNSDEPTIFRASEKWQDGAAYDAEPPEGEILVRAGGKLVPSGVRV